MKENKPKSIKTIGLLVSLLAGFIIFSNSMGLFAWNFNDFAPELKDSNQVAKDPFSFLIFHYSEMCLTMIALGVCFLIGGIFIRKYQLWASRLVSIVSVLLILIIVFVTVALSVMLAAQGQLPLIAFAVFGALVWATPIFLLIRFLNRAKIKKHFV
ncbi:hypothetical protein [Halocola ammonii]